MKLIGIDLDLNTRKSDLFFNNVKTILDVDIIQIPRNKIMLANHQYEYAKFTRAAFDLEDFLFSNKQYWSINKPFINVILCWDNYLVDKIEYLTPYLQIYNTNLIIFSNLDDKYSPPWIFGNAIAIVKWASLLFKLDKNPPTKADMHFYSNFELWGLYWMAHRIGLDVITISDIVRN